MRAHVMLVSIPQVWSSLWVCTRLPCSLLFLDVRSGAISTERKMGVRHLI